MRVRIVLPKLCGNYLCVGWTFVNHNVSHGTLHFPLCLALNGFRFEGNTVELIQGRIQFATEKSNRGAVYNTVHRVASRSAFEWDEERKVREIHVF
jgi:hypothetical protein